MPRSTACASSSRSSGLWSSTFSRSRARPRAASSASERGRIVIETSYLDGCVEGSYEEYADGELISKQLWANRTPVEINKVGKRPGG